MICPKCKSDLPDEASFCPYCMTKFGEVEDLNFGTNLTGNKKKKIITISAIGVLILVILTVVLLKFVFSEQDSVNSKNDGTNTSQSDGDKADVNMPDDATGNDTDDIPNADNESASGNQGETALDINAETFCGTWYNKDFEGEDPELEGGNVLKIISINKDKVVFDLASYQEPSGMRVAEIMGVEADIEDGKAEFVFRDDGWGNGGIGTLIFFEDKVCVNIKLTMINSESLWQLGADTEFKKVDEGYVNDTVDFYGLVGMDIAVAKERLKGIGCELQDGAYKGSYQYEGIVIDTLDDVIVTVYVDYTMLPDGYRERLNFFTKVNGNADYEDMETRLGKPADTWVLGPWYVSTFKVPEQEGVFFDIAFEEGVVSYIKYYLPQD